ncbi:MAG: DUF3347 domain-containing protein [Chitinophagaceae bacterium]
MKKILLLVALSATLFTLNSFSQDSTKQSYLPQLLSLYYGIKDALVASNAATAALKAGSFVKAVQEIDATSIPGTSISILLKDAGKIAATKNLEKQREIFAGFSSNMVALAKTGKLGDKPVYEAYCPMKKSSWLSSEKAIKNPYYGSSMLTCGEVTSTIQ